MHIVKETGRFSVSNLTRERSVILKSNISEFVRNFGGKASLCFQSSSLTELGYANERAVVKIPTAKNEIVPPLPFAVTLRVSFIIQISPSSSFTVFSVWLMGKFSCRIREIGKSETSPRSSP